MSGENGKFATFAAGLVIGGVVGATIGVLKAPRPGEESREDLRAKSIELRNTAEQSVDDALASIKSTAREVSSRAEELRTQSQAMMDETQRQWTAATEGIQDVAAEAIEEIKKATATPVEKNEEHAVETG